MAPTPRFTSLVFATLWFSLHVKAQPGQSLTFDTAIPTGPIGGCLTASSNADGAPVIIQACPVGATPSASETSRTGTFVSLSLASDVSLCIAASANSTSAPVTVETCSSKSPTQTWIGLGVGIIKSVQNSSLCLATNGDATSPGTKLLSSDCSQSNPANGWDPDWQAGRVEQCIDLTDGKKTAGTQLQIWNCTAGNTNQNWVTSFNF
ncbi:hypothetical protein DFH08DRAFT_945632 [Mycena albidolilacea]|uniref:Ricin B lectin domain-containing protein n=1 Tax=Mycena albidolilacea TaxID=1033008 RepID=A0AAD7E900_9AGAR|nr:hypothetical protein DFH08DRAFT_945632 [Mycena albidolilacea]